MDRDESIRTKMGGSGQDRTEMGESGQMERNGAGLERDGDEMSRIRTEMGESGQIERNRTELEGEESR